MFPWMIWNPILWNNDYIKSGFIMNPMPPLLADIMKAMVNYNNPTPKKYKDLATECHEQIFDFNYPLSAKINKDDFEVQILNHFMLRRIGFDTFNAFQIYLENKLNEIMPYYNILFDSLDNFNLFNDGEKIVRTEVEDSESSSEGNNESDRRYNEYPQNRLNDIKKGSYVTTQNYDTNKIENSANANRNLREETSRSPVDKMYLYERYLNTKKSIMSKIYEDLEILFYELN